MIIERTVRLRILENINSFEARQVVLNNGLSYKASKVYRIEPAVNKNRLTVRGFDLEEEKVLLRRLIHRDPKDADWEKESERFWKNIYFTFDRNGYDFNISFDVPDTKVNDFKNAPENEKYKYGYPVNMTDYYLYRYCLNWSRVANTKEIAMTRKGAKIKYYLHTDAAEAAFKRTAYLAEEAAMKKFFEVLEKPIIGEAILREFETIRGRGDTNFLGVKYKYEDLNSIEKKNHLMDIARRFPEEFVKLAEDEAVVYKALIYKAISQGTLRQNEGNSMIYYGDDIIGETIGETVAYLKKNKGVYEEIDRKIKASTASYNTELKKAQLKDKVEAEKKLSKTKV